ncbi:putative tyrosine-family recombinase/integrase [Candidatus Saccharimonas aalborgensis]|uniref:Putative tyrosine-family recombinase/integrase n=1 Tax=Candidatus Saccharimonas aalborgensis TaxID=1332188 RepID=R4PMF1_9BACT|nr:site-specific integrase [Candidatus Saccharimonas aalborgensis]AGL62074.1 putative tyrosine-family recombinase/integrase [Candidatus Saccharimonas aalborgensis]
MSRRRRGEGTVYKRKEGRYEAACYVNTPLGIRRIRRYATTRKDAEAILVEMRNKNDSGLKANPREERLGAYMDYWLLVVQPSIRRSTLAGYESLVRIYLKPGLGNKYLTKLSVADVQTFIDNQLRTGQSHRTVQKMRCILSAVLQRAAKEERISRNVARLVTIPMYKPKEAEPWSVDELTAFLRAASDHQYYPIYFLMGFYGLRRGEALGLSWSDIDFTNKIIRVRRQVDYSNHTYSYVELKTRASKRNLPILDATLAVLNNLKSTTAGPLPDLIFKTSNGLPVDPNNLRRSFKRISKEAGLPIITLHHLRHTAATNLKNLCVAPRDVQAILGHSHISTTLQIYQHADINDTSEALQKYELQISEKSASSRQIKPSGDKILAEYIKINSATVGRVPIKDLRLMSPTL